MSRYSRVDEDLDEYEEDGYGDAEGEEHEEEEEDPAPKKEVVEYLAMRQKLKEAARKKIARENDSGSSSRDRRKSQLENFGSFFGPSHPVIADRVIQESKSLLETRQMAPRVSGNQKDSTKKINGPSTSAPKNGTRERCLLDPMKTKVQKLKSARDYSFLESDDANVPVASKNVPVRINSDSRSAQVPLKNSKHDQVGRNSLSSGREERRFESPNSHPRPMHNHVNQKMNPGSRPGPRKPEKSLQKPSVGHVSGSSQHGLLRDWDAKKASPSVEKKARPVHMDMKVGHINSSVRRGPEGGSMGKQQSSSISARSSMLNGQRPVSKSQNAALKNSLPERRSIQEPSRGKLLPKQSQPSKPQLTRAPKQHISSQGRMEEDYYRSKPKPKPKLKPEPEVDEAMFELRKLLGNNHRRYADDDGDSSDMEADFRTIQMEEKRSARIAREEDEREAKLIEEEEERERRRKLAKRKR